MSAPKPPAGLKVKAKALWVELTTKYELRADELRVLEDACREVDLIERIETALKATKSLTVSGSMGQKVSHPLMQEIRQHRTVLARLLAQLKLPDDEAAAGAEEGARSSSARAAAEARWRKGA